MNKLLLMQFYLFSIRPKLHHAEVTNIPRHTACQHACVTV